MNWYKKIASDEDSSIKNYNKRTLPTSTYLNIGHNTGKDTIMWVHDGKTLHQKRVTNDVVDGELARTNHNALFPELMRSPFVGRGRIDVNTKRGSLSLGEFVYDTRARYIIPSKQKLIDGMYADLNIAFPGVAWERFTPDDFSEPNKVANTWYKKIKTASITFGLNDAYKISQPKDINSLTFDFSTFCAKNKLYTETFRASAYNNMVSPDGNDWDQMTGTINVYAPTKSVKDGVAAEESFNPEEYKRNILSWIEDKKIEGYEMSVDLENPDVSRLTGGPVYRIRVITNPSVNYQEIPEINMANGNAYAIMRLLGLGDEPSGSISLQDLRQRIIQVSQEEMQTETIEPGHINPNVDFDLFSGNFDPADDWKQEDKTLPNRPEDMKGPSIMHGGRDINYIDDRLQGLYALVDFGLQNGFKEVIWG